MATCGRSGIVSVMLDPPAPARLLLAYDGSQAAADAVRAAARLFPGAHAMIAHVREEPLALEHLALARVAVPDAVLVEAAKEYDRAAEDRAWALAERGRALAEDAGLTATSEVRGEPTTWRALCQAAADEAADLIVCGSRGRGAFSRALLGSTSSSLVHHADCAVLVVPPGAGALDGPTLIGYDGSEGARAAIAAGARLLPDRPALVAHAWSSPMNRSFVGAGLLAVPLDDVEDVSLDLEQIFSETAHDVAEEGAALARDARLDARGMAVEATPGAWRALSATGRAEGAAVIVAGCRGRSALASTLLGSVSAGLVHNAELPILIVRP
jgi:nucleotide-binding universal stress UspA family protein